MEIKCILMNKTQHYAKLFKPLDCYTLHRHITQVVKKVE